MLSTSAINDARVAGCLCRRMLRKKASQLHDILLRLTTAATAATTTPPPTPTPTPTASINII